MALNDELRRVLDDESAPSEEWVDSVMRDHPYFALPLLLLLKRNQHASDRDERLARLAIASPDRQALALQLGDGVEQFAHFYPEADAPSTPDTLTTIDRFLGSYGNTSQKEIEVLEQAIFNPTPDYADVLAAQERDEGHTDLAEPDEQDRRINRFIAQSQARAQQAVQGPEKQHVNDDEKQEIADAQVAEAASATDSMLSESLAKMYIARKKYAQALEIIENISLNFPEKSIYFADQIRFLRKLVWLEKKQNTNINI